VPLESDITFVAIGDKLLQSQPKVLQEQEGKNSPFLNYKSEGKLKGNGRVKRTYCRL